MNYGLNLWGDSNFVIDGGKVCLNTDFKPALIDIVRDIRAQGYRGPMLLRFPHLIKNRSCRSIQISSGQNANFPTRASLARSILKG